MKRSYKTVAANRHDAVDAIASQHADHGGDAILHLQGVGARGAEDRATHRQDASNARGRQLVDHALLETAGPAVLNTADPVAELEGAPGDRPDRRV